MIYDEIWIDINKFESGYAVAARQNEDNAQLKVIVTNSGEKIDNSKYSLEFLGNNPKNELTDGRATRIYSEPGAYTYTFSQNNLSVPGKFKHAYFKVIDTNKKEITSANFSLQVKRQADMNAEQAAIHVSLLDETLKKYNKELTEQAKKWDKFIKDNKGIIESIDPGGKILSEIIDARGGENDLNTRLENETKKVSENLNILNEDIGKKRDKTDKVELSEIGDTTKKYIDTKRDSNEPITMSELGQDVKKAMTGGSVAVVGEDSVADINVVDKSLSKNKLSYIQNTKDIPNFFTRFPNKKFGGFHKSDGSFETNKNWDQSEIVVSEGEIYKTNKNVYHWTFFDAQGKFLSGFGGDTSNKDIVIPKNANFLRMPYEIKNCDDNIIIKGTNLPTKLSTNEIDRNSNTLSYQASNIISHAKLVGNHDGFNISKEGDKFYLNIPKNTNVYFKDVFQNIVTEKVLLSGLGAKKGSWLYYNQFDKKIICTNSNIPEFEYYISLGVFYDTENVSGWHLNTDLPFKFNGVFVSKVKGVSSDGVSPLGKYGEIAGRDPIFIDRDKKTLTFKKGTYIRVDKVNYEFKSDRIFNLPNLFLGNWLFYDTKKDDMAHVANENSLFLGAYWVAPDTPQLHTKIPIYIDGIECKTNRKFPMKKIGCLGDSITEGVNTTKAYHTYFNHALGVSKVLNYGIGGTSISKKVGDFPSWDTKKSFVERFEEMDNSLDIITVFGGVNDWVSDRPVGKLEDKDITTFCGACNVLFSGLRKKYVGKPIFAFSAMQNNWEKRQAAEGTPDGKNRSGHYLIEYVEAYIKIAKKYAIPVCDMYSEMFYPFDEDFCKKYMSDYLHPTNEGHLLMAEKMVRFIETY